jgi:hypothetical protein
MKHIIIHYPNNHLVCYGNLISMLEPKEYSQLESEQIIFMDGEIPPNQFGSFPTSEQYDQISSGRFVLTCTPHIVNI